MNSFSHSGMETIVTAGMSSLPLDVWDSQFSPKHGVLKRFFSLSKVYSESENPSGQDP